MKTAMTWNVTAVIADTGTGNTAYTKVSLMRDRTMQVIRTSDEKDIGIAMSRPTVIIITGNGVTSKEIQDNDPSVERIMKNKELYTTVHTNAGPLPSVDFIRKERVSENMSGLERQGAFIIGIIVSRSDERDILNSLIAKECECRLSFSMLRKDIGLAASVCGQIYRTIKLPVLITCLFVLIVNRILYADINVRLQEKRTEHAAMMKSRKVASEADGRQKMLQKRFGEIPSAMIPSVTGRIADAVPEKVRLTSLNISFPFPDEKRKHSGITGITAAGETFCPENIVKMSGNLMDEAGFSTVNIMSMGTDRNIKGLTRFELSISE